MLVMGGDRPGAGLAVALLGSVEIAPAGGMLTPVAQPRLRVLLGLLGVAQGRVVTAEALVDGLWGEEWSPEREKNLHALVYQLRRRLAALEPEGAVRLARAGTGYRLVLRPGELDAQVFRDLAGRGREAARAGDAAGARELLAQALGLWRGTALADAAPLCTRLAGEAAQLEEARLAVVEERIGCDLALGRHGEVAGELAGLVSEFPLRERLAGLLMTALYRCGRRGEALAAYEAARRVLAGELGLDPGPELAALQAQVLADDPALVAPAPALPGGAAASQAAAVAAPGVVPRQLPAGAGFFAGREAELKQLDELLDQAGGQEADGPGGAVVISAVAGMAGVGKTALAVHWARKVAGRFPDGQLYVNLRGYDAEGAAVTAEEVTGWFLIALGVPAGQIPADAQARCGLYRSVLAGRRVLIVLDNARDAAQVRPLLPGSGGCLVVVTSRSALAGLAAAEGARPLRLGPLAAEEGVRLLAARLGPERVAAEPGAVTELVARCGHLPLALAVTAARAAADPGLRLGVLAEQLAAAAGAEAVGAEAKPRAARGGHGAAGGAGDRGPGDQPAPASVLVVPPAQPAGGGDVRAGGGALRAGHHGPGRGQPGRGVPPAGGAGAGRAGRCQPGRRAPAGPVRAAQPGPRLRRRSSPAGAGRGRDPGGGRAQRGPLPAHRANLLRPPARRSRSRRPRRACCPRSCAGEAELQDWAQADQQVLLQAIAQAAAAGLVTRAWQMFFGQAWSLGGQGYWADCLAVAEVVLAAAEAAGEQVALGWTHATVGRYGTFTGAHDEDRAHLARAVDHFRRAGDLSGQAWAHLFASGAYTMTGDLAEAIVQSGQALALFRQTGDRYGEGWALAGLGVCHAYLGDYELARGYAGQALEVTPETGDPTTLAMAWHARALVHSRLGEHTPGDQLLPAGPGLGPRAEEPDGPRGAGHHAGRVRRRLPGHR